jgi:starch phosphorylase
MHSEEETDATGRRYGQILRELALDMRWSWNHAADELWSRLDPDLWNQTHNPWVLLQTVSRSRIESLAADPGFRDAVNQILREKQEFRQSRAWFQNAHAHSNLTSVAYFSMEFMLSEALPIYSGGLGNVAGDQLKAASDLGVPVAGVGLLYQQGYFRQEIDANGAQLALYPFNDPAQLPIRPLRDPDGEWLRLSIRLPGFDLWLRAWEVRVGRTALYLLDSNDPANLPHFRGITSELYGGGPELRLRQELILGIGGWRLLKAIGLNPEVCHLNEGHAAFVVLERARCYMEQYGAPFDLALTVTRAGNIFTTHTPVEAGFDRFSPRLLEQYFRSYAEDDLGIPMRDFLALGRQDAQNSSEPFNMAYLGVRGSGVINGVSRLHGSVSRRIFQPLFPRWPEQEVPVGHVTNGVHVPSWDSQWSDQLWTTACGKERWLGDLTALERQLSSVPDAALWQMRAKQRKRLVEFVRDRLSRQLESQGAAEQEVAAARRIFEFDTLTLGFARRFATYKRPNLLLHDPERLLRLLTDGRRPVQLILAGKAHPEDAAGQAMIHEWIDFLRRPEARPHVVFLSDYDMLLTGILVQGVDVWINTPRRPWEACGTSGMKVLVNGGLNLSELDGWWAEAYSPETGWMIGDGREHGDDPAWDAEEAEQLYRLLEEQVIPEFYAREDQGMPSRWLARMRESMARLTPRFSSNRTVREYVDDYYLPAASAYRERAQDGGKLGADVLGWKQRIERLWGGLRFGDLSTAMQGEHWFFEVQVYLGDLHPGAVQVQLYTEQREGGQARIEPMERGRPLAGSANGFVYSARVPADRPQGDYTPRVVPYHRAAFVPMEANQILWRD